jgi:hypothetical protein
MTQSRTRSGEGDSGEALHANESVLRCAQVGGAALSQQKSDCRG